MRIMVMGDSASGKSLFANKLGEQLSIPVLHLDMIMDSVGRSDRKSIRDFIQQEITKDEWIIDGNAFTKDKEERIRASDMIFVFDFHPFKAFLNHIHRYLKLKFSVEKMRYGSSNNTLNLRYFIPYMFFKFPRRKREAVELAQSLSKKLIFFHTRSEATAYLIDGKINIQ